MFKHLTVLLIFTVFIIQLLLVPLAKAGDNIPSDKEVEYAKSLYVIMKNFDTKESGFAKRAGTFQINDNTGIKNAFKDKFDYTKEYYMKVRALQPTSKFVQNHTEIQQGIYGTLQYIQTMIKGLEKGEKFQQLTISNQEEFKTVSNKYSGLLKGLWL